MFTARYGLGLYIIQLQFRPQKVNLSQDRVNCLVAVNFSSHDPLSHYQLLQTAVFCPL